MSSNVQATLAHLSKQIEQLYSVLPPLQYMVHGPDRRLPVEIWSMIFRQLYPSQICRLSRTSKTMHKIICSNRYWSKLFQLAFGPDLKLRTLQGRPESESFMLFTCVISPVVCERCFRRCGSLRSGSNMPVPVLVPVHLFEPDSWTERRGDDFACIGRALNSNWIIRLCSQCVQETRAVELPRSPTNFETMLHKFHRGMQRYCNL